VVKVSNAGTKRVNLAGLIAFRPGPTPQVRLIHRCRVYHGRKNEPKGFDEHDYIRLLDAAHQQLRAPIVLVWDKCAVWRFAVSPVQPGGTRREVPGSPDLPGGESRRGPQHVREAVSVGRRSTAACRETRVIWPRLDCLKPNLQGCKDPPVGTTPETDAVLCPAFVVPAGQPPQHRTPPSEGGQGDEWAAYVALDTYSEDVPRDRLQGASPMVTECP
jgi:hypothetical protein